MNASSQEPISAIVNGYMVPAARASIPLTDRGFRYGDGLFETIAVASGRPYQLDWHIERLKGGLKALRITFDTESLPRLCRELLTANRLKDGLLRLQVTRGSGGRGYLPVSNEEAFFVMETLSMPQQVTESVNLWLDRALYKPASPLLPSRYKLCQGVPFILARMAAQEQNCFDTLLTDASGQLCESSSGNIFWFKAGTLYTPSLDGAVLEGSTRAAILRLSPYPVQEVRAPLDELQKAEAVFLTNVAWPVVPVQAVQREGWRWRSETLANEMRSLILADRTQGA